MHPFPALVDSWKAISVFPGWTVPHPLTGYIRFQCPLEIGGVTEAGLMLKGGTYSTRPECHVTIELFVLIPGLRLPLMRIDWKGDGHSNRRNLGPKELAGQRFPGTHLHAFELNWVADENRMRKSNLPVAMGISEELQSFADLRTFVGNRFKISNIDVVETPPWLYLLI